MWLILFGLLALALGVLLAITTVSHTTSAGKPSDPWLTFEFIVIWPSGPITYRWSIGKLR